MGIIKKIAKITGDPNRDFQERSFLLLTTIADAALLAVIIGDIILGENIIEIAVLTAAVMISLAAATMAMRTHKITLGGIIISVAGTFIVIPTVFFFGGGLEGGAILWFTFAYLYVGLLLNGVLRTVMFVVITVIACTGYYIQYFFPELIVPHTREMFFLDSLVSVFVVSMVIFIIVLFQNKMFAAENKRAREEAAKVEKLNLSQNRFFSNMSHEIRTPINTIIGMNEMIMRENVSEEVADDAENIQAASRMLLHLINDILDMSKFESGQMQLSPTNYRTVDMLSEIVAMLQLRAREKALEFRVSLAPDLPSQLTGDDVRIKQILINVLNNAIKYTNEGSVALSVQCGAKSGDTVSIIYTVTDTGIGIKKEDIPYLFTAYKRADEDYLRHIEGTGLGLSIVKQLVDLMGGRVTVNSVYTKGTTFIIEIPQKCTDEQTIGNIELENRPMRGALSGAKQKFEAPKARVLVVDDSASNLLVATKLLRETKVITDTASSGKEALKKTLNNEYHVIFMDHLMPEMDGIECHRQIRAQIGGRCRKAKIVALTANVSSDSRLLYEREGFDGYIVKPINCDELENELFRLLPKDLTIISGNSDEIIEETVSWMRTEQKKRYVAITTESVADLPQEFIDRYDIAVIPHMVCTRHGTFKDGLEIETSGLLSYMKSPKNKVETKAPDVQEHEMFFAKQLSYANNIIHIAVSGKVSNSGYPAALEAAAAFDNVTVVDSGHLSGGQAFMVLEACRLAEEGKNPDEIARKLEQFKDIVHTSFIVENLDFLARANQVSQRIAGLTRSFMARPVLMLKNGVIGVGRVYFGSREHAWRRYIVSTLKNVHNIDRSLLLVNYSGLTKQEIDHIEAMIEEQTHFDKIFFRQASPAISVNCGPGTFGLLIRELDD